mmetsp:Transcript_15654/g.39746  ORF Transcript_15654/g.39746 Transcript_15654/m.39746 type:complete len:192 (-) Transcript_15654:137-712(-)|eukprot:CAMPEP_0113905052 /NCGR_PEP_ID=MMETSP0780_2-20120614/23727_1 /TAXON_ID=652834 /ORGANISM="Palpitomonas bilix" /LENGTH=191 /DNA_ID=CAMNT_0000898997 /DNA_START=1 /DNA_END=576 /DNA_ORIENTATION=- /assembly_acc=CAM_ASM_000599
MKDKLAAMGPTPLSSDDAEMLLDSYMKTAYVALEPGSPIAASQACIERLFSFAGKRQAGSRSRTSLVMTDTMTRLRMYDLNDTERESTGVRLYGILPNAYPEEMIDASSGLIEIGTPGELDLQSGGVSSSRFTARKNIILSRIMHIEPTVFCSWLQTLHTGEDVEENEREDQRMENGGQESLESLEFPNAE